MNIHTPYFMISARRNSRDALGTCKVSRLSYLARITESIDSVTK